MKNDSPLTIKHGRVECKINFVFSLALLLSVVVRLFYKQWKLWNHPKIVKQIDKNCPPKLFLNYWFSVFNFLSFTMWDTIQEYHIWVFIVLLFTSKMQFKCHFVILCQVLCNFSKIAWISILILPKKLFKNCLTFWGKPPRLFVFKIVYGKEFI